jgi:uncharacterized repeat protein (TIGR03803 family)
MHRRPRIRSLAGDILQRLFLLAAFQPGGSTLAHSSFYSLAWSCVEPRFVFLERPEMKYFARALAISVALCASRADSQTFTTLLSFTGTSGAASSAYPAGGLIASGGTLYGMTAEFGVNDNGYGKLFSVGTNGTNYQNLISFTGTGATASGWRPSGSLIASGGTLFGMTADGGANGDGNIFSVGTSGTNFQNLVSFTGTSGTANGSYPLGSLVASGGTLFGMTYQGGANGYGNIFSVGLDGTNYRNVVSFTGTSGSAIGKGPYDRLIASGGTLYGMTPYGGTNGNGNIFSIGLNGTNFQNLVSFTGNGGTASGKEPYGSLILSGTTFYGVTSAGGANGDGTVFSVGLNGTNYHNLVSFKHNAGVFHGSSPSGTLILSGTTLYGTTSGDGIYSYGNIFSVGVNGSGYLDLYDFTGGADGDFPNGDLLASGGTLFGMTGSGGANGDGTVFALSVPALVPEPGTLALVGAMLLGGFVWRRRWRRLAIIGAIALPPSSVACADVFNMPAGQTSLQFVTVGDPGNSPDPATGGTLGHVGYTFSMGKYDVTLGQYVQFLNAVAKTDTYGLYSPGMGSGFFGTRFGISQTGSPGSLTYAVTGSAPGKDNMPVSYVSWGDAARFCNWLDNGQGTASNVSQAYALTETGAYALNGATSVAALMAVSLPAHSGSTAARYFIPSENEWYKAAYYKSGGTNSGYWTYPTRSSSPPDDSFALANSESNDANYNFANQASDLTPVGTFILSMGPYGTFDQGGDVYQWNEANFFNADRATRGGAFGDNSSSSLSTSYRNISPPDNNQSASIGFRVASSVPVPEPCTLALLCVGGMALFWTRRRARAWLPPMSTIEHLPENRFGHRTGHRIASVFGLTSTAYHRAPLRGESSPRATPQPSGQLPTVDEARWR